MIDIPEPPAPSAQPPQPAPIRKRSIIYIDGFNFYYGLLHEQPDLKWLNYQRLAELLRPDDDILQVKLFSALEEVKRLDRSIHLAIYIPAPENELKYRRNDDFGKFGQVKPIPEKFLRQSQFPDKVPNGKGGFIERPKAWPPAIPPSK